MRYAYDVLEELRSRGVKLGIVTNGWVEAQTQTLRGLDLPRRVDDVVISKAAASASLTRTFTDWRWSGSASRLRNAGSWATPPETTCGGRDRWG